MARSHKLARADFPTTAPDRRVHNELFSLSVWAKQPFATPQFTCVVSKKTAQKAADRNRMKRRCKDTLRQLLKAPAPPAVIVVYPKKAVLAASAGDIRESLAALLAKVRPGGKPRQEIR